MLNITRKRALPLLIIFAWTAVLLIIEQSFDLLSIGINLIFTASQVFWFRRASELGQKLIGSKTWRRVLAAAGLTAYAFLLIFNLLTWEEASKGSALTFRAALLEAPLRWWLLGSLLGFLLYTLFWIVNRVARAAGWAFKKRSISHGLEPPSPGRRRFLEQTATAFCSAPFVAGAYGLFYGRLNLEVTHQHIRLARLPKAFEGCRIAQLSDIHISPFMTAAEIRRCVTMTNEQKPDLIVMTGDYLSWDTAWQGEVVQALAGLRAPYGVFGSLGNHESITQTEESITRLFAAQGIHILRQERAPIQLNGETINLIGVDDSQSDDSWIDHLVMPDTVNILLTHVPVPAGFDWAVEHGFDLVLAGDSHGGQLSLNFLKRRISFYGLYTPYVSGLYEKSGGQLYVNRGIGTTILPIRLGARPEITVFELTRGV
jgi:predicted MPP superfamily phosphohydrolase